jgi:hypothetical protein
MYPWLYCIVTDWQAILNKNINATCNVFVSWAELKDPRNLPYSQKAYFSQILCTNLFYIPVSEHFSFAKIIHPLDRHGISRLNGMIITQVHLMLETIKDHSNMWSFVTQHNAKFWWSVHLACWLQECPTELLPEILKYIFYHKPPLMLF